MVQKGMLVSLLVEIAPFVVLFVLYALLAYPLYLKKKMWWHTIVAFLLLAAFGLWCFTLGHRGPERYGPGGPGFGGTPKFEQVPPPPGPSFSQGTPPSPDGFGPGGPGDQKGPGRFRPELTKLFIALMILIVERSFLDWVREKSRRRKETADDAVPADDLVIKFARKTVTIPLGSIIYIESMSEYVKFHLDEPAEAVVVLGSLKKLMEMLPADRFIRIHRSYIVATDRIREAGTASVTLDGGLRLPVGDSYRSAVKEWSGHRA